MAKRKTKMGRPPKDPRERKTSMMCIRFTPAEYKLLQRDAKKTRTTPTEYLRACWQKVRQ